MDNKVVKSAIDEFFEKLCIQMTELKAEESPIWLSILEQTPKLKQVDEFVHGLLMETSYMTFLKVTQYLYALMIKHLK